ncbi:PREDICTED: ankyrin repeat-containing protein At5g02620-like [Erythranthe guttata]|uniref:ankyrin repeat-containing protein At5g02620-like n=1 Tax=Erythranthe guttata TaxID=4155 RepID=UPI00064DDC3A|nr:PREDICTED: ankyrin repeat-containing protein At5g02620-like [Erythranthe guttata]|eukprot:XP_012850842.1 PREDICTED: ankyrin repeat-containing protein At5g02620-like [Erythranthe guttata]
MGRIDINIAVERRKKLEELQQEPTRRRLQSKIRKDKRLTTRTLQSRIQDDDTRSKFNNYHVIDIYKNYDLYQAAQNGSSEYFGRVLDRVSSAETKQFGEILRRVSPAGNTLLHIAAKHGNEDAVTYIAAKVPSLLLIKNDNGETALHLAAKAGYESVVKMLVLQFENGADENYLLRAKNERGNTALHEALINGSDSIAQYLIQKDPEVSYYDNNEGECALYLAAKSDVLEAMLSKNPSLIQSRDGTGRTPLHCAASLGYLEEVGYLLQEYLPSAFQRDGSGSFPIHLASIKGNVQVISLLLEDCPDPEEMLDGDGCNILHIAARNGRCNVVSYVLKSPYLKNLINMKDKHGNTPLHLATMNWHPKIVSALTWDNRVDVTLVNDKGMTALDAADHYMPDNPQFPQRLTWAALKTAGTPRSLSRETVGRQAPKKSSDMDNYKERVNTLLLVATLVATITFAAGFTLPGGYNTDTGMATMLGDAIAMYSSIVVAVTLIWAQLGDIKLAFNALTLAVPLLGIALCMMSIAFTAGVFLVVSKLRLLSTAVLVMGITFLAIMSIILIPLCSSHTSSNRIVRYLSYYPFYLLILASSS